MLYASLWFLELPTWGLRHMGRIKRSDGAAKRSEVVTVRLDPKLKYLAELAARKHRRPLSSFIEWAVEESLSKVVLKESNAGSISVADAERMLNLWDLDEPDRIVRLAINFPDLLTLEEQMIWKLVRENGSLWRGSYEGGDREWEWKLDNESIVWDNIREHWDDFREVARGTKPASVLPTWKKTDAIPF